jgi:hypothetical protein
VLPLFSVISCIKPALPLFSVISCTVPLILERIAPESIPPPSKKTYNSNTIPYFSISYLTDYR